MFRDAAEAGGGGGEGGEMNWREEARTRGGGAEEARGEERGEREREINEGD